MSQRTRRSVDIFNLSFLDVVSCGFGAIILLLVIVKISEPNVIEKLAVDLSGLVARLEAELHEIRGETGVLNRDLTARQEQLSAEREKLARLQGARQSLILRVSETYFNILAAQDSVDFAYAERTAINAPMQGTAADVIKRAMIDVDSALKKSKLNARVVMQVHDELVIEVAKKETDALIELVRDNMQSAAELRVPLVVDIGIGDNWDEAH